MLLIVPHALSSSMSSVLQKVPTGIVKSELVISLLALRAVNQSMSISPTHRRYAPIFIIFLITVRYNQVIKKIITIIS